MAVKMKQWKFEEKEYHAKIKVYNDFWAGLYGTVLGQYTEVIRSTEVKVSTQAGVSSSSSKWDITASIDPNSYSYI